MGFFDIISNLDVALTVAKSKAWCAKEELKNKDLDDIKMDIECGAKGLLRDIDCKIHEFGLWSEYLSEELSGKTMVEDNNAKVAYINKLNEEMEKIATQAKNLNAKTREDFNKSNSRLFEKKQEVYVGTIKDFADTFTKIKNAEYEDFKVNKLKLSKLQKQELTFSPCFAGEIEDFISLNNVIAFAVAGGLGVMISAAWKSIELDEKMIEAEKEHAALRAKCEQNKRDCAEVKGIIGVCDSTYQTIIALDELTKRLIAEVENVISTSGNQYDQYNDEERDKVMLMIDFALVLNHLVCVEMFRPNGNQNPYFEEVYKEAQRLIKE